MQLKCIEKALTENEYKPRKKWWGYLKNGTRFLMRYNHCLASFTEAKIVHAVYQTKTDKQGVECAINMWKENKIKYK